MSIKQHKDDQVALRKQLIQMRLELNRQKIHHEGLVLLEPLQKLRGFQHRFTQGSTPLLMVAGVTLASFLMTRHRRSASSLLPVVRVASSFLPFLLAGFRSRSSKNSEQTDSLGKIKRTKL